MVGVVGVVGVVVAAAAVVVAMCGAVCVETGGGLGRVGGVDQPIDIRHLRRGHVGYIVVTVVISAPSCQRKVASIAD